MTRTNGWAKLRLRGSSVALWGIAVICLVYAGHAEGAIHERVFPQPKTAVDKAVEELESSTAGRLPLLEGFAAAGVHPLEQYRRGYYQCSVRVNSKASGETLVQVSAKITAWYSDPASSKSDYEELPSNGRLEQDYLDRLQEALSKQPSASTVPIPKNRRAADARSSSDVPGTTLSAPMPGSAKPVVTTKHSSETTSSPFATGSTLTGVQTGSLPSAKTQSDPHREELATQAKNLEEILQDQAHPNNLAAVSKPNTEVLSSPDEGAKVLFLASAEDEFEILDVNPSWVHVRISGLSRGWIRRPNLEMPGNAAINDSAVPVTGNSEPGLDNHLPFRVTSEEIAAFPGSWEPLQGKMVKIVSLQKAGGYAEVAAKRTFVRSLFAREYSELSKGSIDSAGVLLIFDSDDGGMVAATTTALRQWTSGSLSDEAFWQLCLFDPPEAFSWVAIR